MKMNFFYLIALLGVVQLIAKDPQITIKNITENPHHVVLKLENGKKIEFDLGKGEEQKFSTKIATEDIKKNGDDKKLPASFVKKITAINTKNGQKRKYELTAKEKKLGLKITIGEKTEEIYNISPFTSEFGGLTTAEKTVAMVPDIRVS